MGGASGEERAGAVGSIAAREADARTERAHAEAGHDERALRQAQGAQDLLEELLRRTDERRKLLLVCPRVVLVVERSDRLVDRARQHRGAPVVERVREAERWVNPVEAKPLERHRPQGGCDPREWVDGRAHVVNALGERQLRAASPTTDRACGFDEMDGESGFRERDRSDEPVRSRANDDGVEGAGAWSNVAQRDRTSTSSVVERLTPPQQLLGHGARYLGYRAPPDHTLSPARALTFIRRAGRFGSRFRAHVYV